MNILIPPERIIREPWVTTGMMKSSRTLDKLYKLSLKKPPTHPSVIEFKSYRNRLNRLKATMKQEYYHNLFSKYKKDITKSWEVMRSIIKKTNDKSGISDTFRLNDVTLNDPSQIANEFCNYFTEIGPKLSAQIPTSNKSYDQYMVNITIENSMFLNPTDPNEIMSTIRGMNLKKALVLIISLHGL